MDISALHKLAGEGEQTIINAASGTVTGNFYKVFWVKGGTITTVTVDGQSGTPIDGMAATRHLTLYNVTSITLGSGIAIGYTL
jgi:hypothetical protein